MPPKKTTTTTPTKGSPKGTPTKGTPKGTPTKGNTPKASPKGSPKVSPSPPPQSYKVFRLKFTLSMVDPDMPTTPTRYHNIIFVETNAEGPGSGIKHHVTGDLVSGMRYEWRPYHNPDGSRTMHSKELIGSTKPGSHLPDWEALLRSAPAPPKQKAYNTKTNKTEPFKTFSPLTFYAPGEARAPLKKCTEWTEEVIPLLKKKGLLI